MGTNYYGRIIPKEKDIKELHAFIDINDFSKIRQKVHEIYGSFRPYSMDDKPIGEVHLGKHSGGWKFLWNPNIYKIRNGHSEATSLEDGITRYRFVPEPDTAYYLYPLTKKGIKEFIDREDVEIYDEYGEQQDKDEFFKEALDWTKWNGLEAWDSNTYHKEYPSEKVWSCKNDYTDFLESLGYILSDDKSDFYSDGLRFSTSTEFC